jgi:outer membrane lipoprotein-sorting protein
MITFVASVCLAPIGCGWQNDNKVALAYLAKSMQRSFSVNVVTLIEQRDPANDQEMQLVKVERSKSGKVRHSIQMPIRMQGITSIDDGDRSMMYLPDEKVIINQESPQKEPNDVSFRLELAANNYDFKVSKGQVLAGRQTMQVTAIPKDNQLDIRRYSIDEKTSYPLRLEVISPGGNSETQYDTKDIKYPSRLDEAIFQLRTIGGVSTLNYKRASLKNSAEAEKMVGFVPIVPATLALGFRVQNVQINENLEWKSVAIRITDGLVRATVYQWRPSAKDEKIQTLDNRSMFDRKGIRVMIVSDLSTPLRNKLLKAFYVLSENSDDTWRLPPLAMLRRNSL